MNIPAQIGNYTLDREIGSGGTSRVWLAHHTNLPERVVAIKVLMSQEREAIRRFEREALIAVRLRHANIVQLYDYGYTQPFFYSLLEYIAGGSLRELIKQQGRLPLDVALPIFRQIATGLDYAHKKGIIHRDVSPGNILIEQEKGRALLTDFGIARTSSTSGQAITIANPIMGTPGFFSPEHMHGVQNVTHLSDLFSLGIVLYHMLSGQLPWDEPPSIPDHPGFSPPIPLRQRGGENLPSGIDRVLLTMLALDPAHRFPSAQAAVDELDRIFSRHTMTTQILPNTVIPSVTLPGDFQASGIETSQVETLLGPTLIRAPLDNAHRRAEEMRNAETIATQLNAWSAQHRLGLRRPLLGRLAHLHKISSANIYFFRLRVLYEERTPPQSVEVPDHTAERLPLIPEMDYWKVHLPEISDFSDHPETAIKLPGSKRVITCAACKGSRVISCMRCNGRGSIVTTRTVTAPSVGTSATPTALNAPTPLYSRVNGKNNPRPVGTPNNPAATLEPVPLPTRTEQVRSACPDCKGRGNINCARCEGAGVLIQEKIFRWSRNSTDLHTYDSNHAINEGWLRHSCKEEVIYRERQTAGFRPEWAGIEKLAPLLAEAQERTDSNTRIVLSELTISFIPVTTIYFDLGKREEKNLYNLVIYGFERIIPEDPRFLNWERVITISLIILVLVLVGTIVMVITPLT